MVSLENFRCCKDFCFFGKEVAFQTTEIPHAISISFSNFWKFPQEVKDFLLQYNKESYTFLTTDGEIALPGWLALSIPYLRERVEGYEEMVLPCDGQTILSFAAAMEKYVKEENLTPQDEKNISDFCPSMMEGIWRSRLHHVPPEEQERILKEISLMYFKP